MSTFNFILVDIKSLVLDDIQTILCVLWKAKQFWNSVYAMTQSVSYRQRVYQCSVPKEKPKM